MKKWHLQERWKGHHVDKADIFLAFYDELLTSLQALDRVHQKRLLTEEEDKFFNEGTKRLESLLANEHWREEYIAKLLAYMGVKLHAPQRYTDLTAEEEALRAELTWQLNDLQLQPSAFGADEELQKVVANPDEFIGARKNTWLVFSDQIPFWIGLGLRKGLYSQTEKMTKAQRRKRLKKEAEVAKATGETENKTGNPQVSQQVIDNEGQSQLRGLDAGKEKTRVTVENRMGIRYYFDEEKDPEGVVLPSILLIVGAHARLSNIDDDNRLGKGEVINHLSLIHI